MAFVPPWLQGGRTQAPGVPTQQGIDRRKQIAQSLMQVGQQGTGLSGPWGAIASALAGGIAGWQQKRAGQEQTALDDDRKKKIAEALAGMGGSPGATAAIGQLPLDQQQGLLGKLAVERMTPKQAEGFTLSPGQQRFGADGQPIASVAAEQVGFTLNPGQQRFGPDGKPIVSAAPELQKVDGGDSWIFTDAQGKEVNRISKNASPDAILAAATQRRGQDVGAETSRTNAETQTARTNQRNAASLRKEFRGLPAVKEYETALPIIESARNAPDTPAGDLQVIYSVGKVLDPNSVVREGELELTQNATPFLQKLVGKARAEISGQGRLTPETRKNLVDMLDQRVKGYEQAYTRDYDSYAQYATDIGAEADQIVGTRPESAFKRTPPLAPTAGPGPAQLASTNGSPPVPQERTATGPNGEKLVLRNGQWQPLQ